MACDAITGPRSSGHGPLDAAEVGGGNIDATHNAEHARSGFITDDSQSHAITFGERFSARSRARRTGRFVFMRSADFAQSGHREAIWISSRLTIPR
jgi:hypothetical protein